jgi:hypothetical protein
MKYEYRLYLKTNEDEDANGFSKVCTSILENVRIGDTIAIPDEEDEMGGSNYYKVVSRTFYEEGTSEVLVEIVAEKEEL